MLHFFSTDSQATLQLWNKIAHWSIKVPFYNSGEYLYNFHLDSCLSPQVLENQVVPISTDHLAFRDLDTPDDEIVYSVLHPLQSDEGTLEHVRNPFVTIRRFTQADINNNRIIYRPPLQEIGTDEKEFSFTFTGRWKYS